MGKHLCDGGDYFQYLCFSLNTNGYYVEFDLVLYLLVAHFYVSDPHEALDLLLYPSHTLKFIKNLKD